MRHPIQWIGRLASRAIDKFLCHRGCGIKDDTGEGGVELNENTTKSAFFTEKVTNFTSIQLDQERLASHQFEMAVPEKLRYLTLGRVFTVVKIIQK